MSIGKRIKERRKELGYNADYIAQKLGVSRSTVFRYEKGDIEKLPTEILEQLAVILNTTPGYLMGWEENNGEQLLNYFQQLSENRQETVLDFTKLQLKQQQNSVAYSTNNEVHTLAAHRVDETETASPEDKAHLMSKLDEMDRKFDEQQKRLKAKEAEKRGPFDE